MRRELLAQLFGLAAIDLVNHLLSLDLDQARAFHRRVDRDALSRDSGALDPDVRRLGDAGRHRAELGGACLDQRPLLLKLPRRVSRRAARRGGLGAE